MDWHQDAQYTFYWYSDLFTSQEQMNEYSDGIVNVFVPLADIPIELGPVQLVRQNKECLRLTKADMLKAHRVSNIMASKLAPTQLRRRAPLQPVRRSRAKTRRKRRRVS